ncbi:MAG TPA: helix-turn-helix domain-containing protein, partial [Actinomycetota bacterium]|nr:helix-turn-helix domain-containing protein [Actinomycetota bacterium]
MRSNSGGDQVATIALLSEPARRALYDYVVGRGREVGRDEAAEAVGVSRALAAFHLDKLADAGLLEVSYRRLSGRRGPGAGRPAKVYRRSSARLDVSIPPRRYEMLAGVLARTLEQVGESGAVALQEEARRLGAEIGAEGRTDGDRGPEAVEAVLAENGFEPAREDDGRIVLRNCPFDSVARASTELVCGANVEFMRGVLDGSGASGLRVSLEPEEGRCCAVFRPTDRPAGASPTG